MGEKVITNIFPIFFFFSFGFEGCFCKAKHSTHFSIIKNWTLQVLGSVVVVVIQNKLEWLRSDEASKQGFRVESFYHVFQHQLLLNLPVLGLRLKTRFMEGGYVSQVNDVLICFYIFSFKTTFFIGFQHGLKNYRTHCW